ncbi:MAG: hypothetical protein QGG71_15085 [Pirellulaceae bacterium]|nr:hypothetical protein [Pirellulaceae bacterium]
MMSRAIRLLLVAMPALLSARLLLAEGPTIPFSQALDAAAISVGRLDSILDHALILGNGDINALVYSEAGQLRLMLTKNDVWDARLDSKLDPPLPTLKLIKKLAAKSQPQHGGNASIGEDGWRNRGSDSYHAHPYPCPRACARLVLSDRPPHPVWRQIRTAGKLNGWRHRDGAAVMSIEGKPGASNGYAFGPLVGEPGEYRALRMTLSGTDNARYYVDVMDPAGNIVFKSDWIDTPTEVEEIVFPLPADQVIGQVILYTWTKDGQLAENRFEKLVLDGPSGTLTVDLAASTLTSAPRPAQLDLRRAVATIEGGDDNDSPTEIRALADRNVFLIKSPHNGQLVPARSADTPDATSGQTDGVAWLAQEIPGDLDWPGMKFTVAVAANAELKAVAIVTSREAKDPLSAAIRLAREAVERDSAQLIDRHDAAWQKFWSASGISVDDALLTSAWYRNLYFLRCVSKPGAIAPGLFASLIHDRPAWHGDYHTNYNIQQTFWSAYVTNHTELAEPYDRLISEYLPRARWLARQVFSMDGAYFPHVLFAYEPPHPQECNSPVGRQYIHHVWGFTQGVNGFSVQPLWWHYKYEPDRQFLETVAYPAVRDVAVFQADFLDQCASEETVEPGSSRRVVVLAPSVSPEHWGWTRNFERNRNCTFDIAMFRYTFQAAIEGAITLGRDAELIERWKDGLRRLPAYPTTGADEPIVVDVQDAPPITYNIAVPATPVFPGDVVTWFSSPAEKQLFSRTIDKCQWNGNNSSIILSLARSRLSMPGAHEWMHRELAARSRPNGTLTLNRLGSGINTYGHYTEQFAASMAVSELLLQSVGNIMRVFPAWPKDKAASFRNLRAQGGFLVSASQEGGRVAQVEVNSTVGGRLHFLSPWPALTVQRGDDHQTVRPDTAGLVQIKTTRGEQLVLRSAPNAVSRRGE